MSSEAEVWQRELARLARRYVERLSERAAELDALRDALEEGPDPGLLARLQAVAHGLKGSGKTFGFPAVSQTARALEELLRSVTAQDLPPSPQQVAELAVRMRHLREAVERARETVPPANESP